MSENTYPIEPFGVLITLTPYRDLQYRTDAGDLYRVTQASRFEPGPGHYRTPIELIELASGHTVRAKQ